MSRKSIIVFILAAGIVAGALVFDGMSHRRSTNSNQAISQSQATATPANESANSSNATAATDLQTEAQPAVAATDATLTTDAGQDPAPDAASEAQNEAQNDENAPAADATPADAPQPIVVPAGATLTVRLGEELGSKISATGQSFSATLDQDVVVNGQTVIAAGATVHGKVAVAKPVGALAGEANLQLKLTSIHVENANLPVATSVRSFGPKIKGKNKAGRFMKGLFKRAGGEEREVVLDSQSAYSFTLRKGLQIQ